MFLGIREFIKENVMLNLELFVGLKYLIRNET